jgi:hypothetical protein
MRRRSERSESLTNQTTAMADDEKEEMERGGRDGDGGSEATDENVNKDRHE